MRLIRRDFRRKIRTRSFLGRLFLSMKDPDSALVSGERFRYMQYVSNTISLLTGEHVSRWVCITSAVDMYHYNRIEDTYIHKNRYPIFNINGTIFDYVTTATLFLGILGFLDTLVRVAVSLLCYYPQIPKDVTKFCRWSWCFVFIIHELWRF